MISVNARPRERALTPCAALAWADAVPALLTRLAELDPARLARLRAVHGTRFLLVLGEGDDLPWVDGLTFLGKDEGAPRLLLPTTHAPTVPSALFERAVARHCSELSPPWAVTLEPPCAFSVSRAEPLSLARVRGLLEARQ